MSWRLPDWLHQAPPSSDRQGVELLESLFAMAFVVEARDPYTGGHLWRVSQYSRLLSGELGLAHGATARTALGGFLHDLGKVAVPDEILHKPDALTDEEFAVVRTHPAVGAHLLERHPLRVLVEPAIRHHHERYDGGGYPDRLAGDTIPLDARIVGIADAFDAMTSQRPYRAAMPMDQAFDIVARETGRQFDPDCVDALLALGRRGRLAPIHGHSDDHIPVQECPICGPTVVVTRHHHPGDTVYCPMCRAEMRLVEGGNGTLIPSPTGAAGTPEDVAPQPDTGLIQALVHDIDEELHCP
ncbi:MAG: HD-GYP domain-containing protein [Dehalococcoidia bacterium]